MRRPSCEPPGWATPIDIDDMRRLVREARRLMPGVGVQIPPNLADWWPELVAAGATDLGGLSANGDHISPEHPFPSPHQVRKRLAADGVALTERLCVYPQYIDQEWMAQGVLDVVKTQLLELHPASRLRAATSRRSPSAPTWSGRAMERARDGERLSREELTALFAETRPRAIEEMRAAADELRAQLAGDTVTFVVNRNINVSNICTVGCAFCGFGQGKRSPDAYEHSEEEFRRRVREAIDYGASEICMQSGIHPDWDLEEYERWLRVAKDEAPHIHLHAYSPMEVAHMSDVSGLAPRAVFERLREAGLDSTPGTAAEVLHDGVRQRISPNKLPVARWVEVIEASHAAGLRSTVTVMFGHVEEPWELAEHMRVVRELQERTGGFTEFVPLSFIPFHTLLGRTHGIEEISRRRTSSTRRPSASPSGAASPASGQLGEDGPRCRHRGSALGRQRPRRHADGGEHQPPRRLLPRRAPRPARADRRRAPRRPPRRRAHDALRHPRAPSAAGAGRGLAGSVAPERRLEANMGIDLGAYREQSRETWGEMASGWEDRREWMMEVTGRVNSWLV